MEMDQLKKLKEGRSLCGYGQVKPNAIPRYGIHPWKFGSLRMIIFQYNMNEVFIFTLNNLSLESWSIFMCDKRR
jgi:hypothetical protein